MNIFLVITIAAIIYWVVMLYRMPRSWVSFLQFVPIVGFMWFARMLPNLVFWKSAFTFGGLLAAGAIAISIQQRCIMNRLFLGANTFLLLGAGAFLFNFSTVLKWYASSEGGPFFTCIAAIGLLTTLFTKTGFVGKRGLAKDAVRYGSFLLFAATCVALVWSIQNAAQGIVVAVVAPFIVLTFIQRQMMYHLK